MPKSKSNQAKKLQSNRNRFIHLFAFYCCGIKPYPSTDDVENEKDAYIPTVTDFTEGLQREARPTLEFTNIKQDIQLEADVTKQGYEDQAAEDLEYPDELNPFADEYVVHSIDDYPEELNPFAEDE